MRERDVMRRQTYRVDEIQLPVVITKGLEGHWVGVVVEAQGSLDANIHNHDALGTELVGENLHGVTDKQTRPGHGIANLEDPDKGDHGIVGTRSVLLFIQGGCEGPEDECDEHATGGGEESRTATELVDTKGHSDRDDQGDDSDASTELQF